MSTTVLNTNASEQQAERQTRLLRWIRETEGNALLQSERNKTLSVMILDHLKSLQFQRDEAIVAMREAEAKYDEAEGRATTAATALRIRELDDIESDAMAEQEADLNARRIATLEAVLRQGKGTSRIWHTVSDTFCFHFDQSRSGTGADMAPTVAELLDVIEWRIAGGEPHA